VVTNGVSFFVGMDGSLQTGWQIVNGGLYYFQADGSLATNITLTIDGMDYVFDANGVGMPILAPAATLPTVTPVVR